MSLINDSILLSISVLHIMVVLFVFMAPFSDNTGLLFMHTIVVPFIIFHWIMNNNNCILTSIEKHVKKISLGVKSPKKDIFVYQFIAPIYDFNNNHKNYSMFIYSFTAILWLISALQLGNRYASGRITKTDDLFIM